MQGSLLRSACFPLIYADHDWNSTLNSHLDIQRKQFEELNDVIKQKLKHLKDNAIDNARKALPEWLNDNWINDGYQLIPIAYSYLIRNFGDDSFIKWGMFVVPSNNVNYRNPALIYVSKSNGLSLVAGIGKVSERYRFDEDYPFKYKHLTCFNIGGNHISYNSYNLDILQSYSQE